MTRRSLFAVGVLLALLVAGCLGGPSGSGSADPDDDGQDGDDTAEPTATASEPTEPTATDGGSAVRDTSFEVLDVRSSDEDETASVAVEDGTVSVTGRIGGNNGCYTARLAEATLADETLVVRVESFEDTTVERDCTQALVVIEYRATVAIAGDRPTSVTVEHNGETVTSGSV